MTNLPSYQGIKHFRQKISVSNSVGPPKSSMQILLVGDVIILVTKEPSSEGGTYRCL
jgi:hypothetical protein